MKIVIAGAGEVGSHLAKMLRAENNEITVVDNDFERLQRLNSYADVETVAGDPTSITVLKNAGTGKADLFIAAHPFSPQEVNIVAAVLARQLGAAKVVARINDEDYLTAENKLIFKELGIELMFYPEKIAADEIVNVLRNGLLGESTGFGHGKLLLATFKLEEDSRLVDLKLGEFVAGLGEDELKQFRIIAISRLNETLIPNLQSKFQPGDVVYVMCRRDGLPLLETHFGMQKLDVNRVMITGGNEIAEMVARALSQHCQVKIIHSNRERCLELTETLPDNVMIINADGRDPDLLFEESIKDYEAFVALSGNDEENILSCVVAKKFGVPYTIAEVENLEYIRLAEEMGVDSVINKKLITASRIFKFTLSGKARFVKYMSNTDAEVLEYTVAPGSAVTRKPIKDLKLPGNAIIGGVIRGRDAFIAVGDTVIEAYDKVAIFALPESIKELDKFFK